jgi:hypothetical protein
MKPKFETSVTALFKATLTLRSIVIVAVVCMVLASRHRTRSPSAIPNIFDRQPKKLFQHRF